MLCLAPMAWKQPRMIGFMPRNAKSDAPEVHASCGLLMGSARAEPDGINLGLASRNRRLHTDGW
jgi:hypothetical protein